MFAAVAACSSGTDPTISTTVDLSTTTTTTTAPSITVPPAPASTPTTTPTSTPTTTTTSPTTSGPGPHGAEVYLPSRIEEAPVAVLVHGGGWVAGLPVSMEQLGRALADRGMVVFNASYRTLMAGGGYPQTFDDVACAVRYARSEASRLGASEDVTLVGHSAGAHLAAVVALTDDTFGGDCPWEGSSVPERWVGLAGIYRLSAVEPVMEALLGGDRQTVPDAWTAADPFEHLAAADDVDMIVIHGIDDEIVPASSSREFALALRDGGVEVTLEVLEGTRHMDMLDPEVTAALIAP